MASCQPPGSRPLGRSAARGRSSAVLGPGRRWRVIENELGAAETGHPLSRIVRPVDVDIEDERAPSEVHRYRVGNQLLSRSGRAQQAAVQVGGCKATVLER